MENLNFNSTKEIKVPKKIVDQVIGQDDGVRVVKKAAEQRRHVILVGEPGTGKSMLGLALAELSPTKEKLQDVLCYPNEKDINNPIIKVFSAGEGEKTILKLRKIFESSIAAKRIALFLGGGIFLLITGFFLWSLFKNSEYGALAIVNGLGTLIWIIFIVALLSTRAPGMLKTITGLAMIPKPLITHKKSDKAPFIDATGAYEGALLGDVLHDPLQSGGLGTPPHERVMPGMVQLMRL